MQIDLLLLSLLRVVVEVAVFALMGQGVLALLAGKHRHDNLLFTILQSITDPGARGVRHFTPRFIIDARPPMLTFFLLLWRWIMLAAVKRYGCGLYGLECRDDG